MEPAHRNVELRFKEKQPEYGRITVLVGPDGGGKSYLANQLKIENPDAILIAGTKPQDWPVSKEVKHRLSRLEERYVGFKYYGLLALALHRTVADFARHGKDVIVDSEQTFKWLMWEDMKGNLDSAVSALISTNKSKVILPESIRYVVPKADSFEEQAKLIWQRQKSKPESEKSKVDPKSLDDVKVMLKASENVLLTLEKLGIQVEGKPDWVK